MEYVDPRVLDRIPGPGIRFDPDTDHLILVGVVPHTPGIYDEGRCETCGYLEGDRIARSKTRRGRVICSNCCRGSLDGMVSYPGLNVGERLNEDWVDVEPNEVVTPPKYQPGALAGGMGTKVKRRKGKVKA
mgnify:CR=1 FL=1